MNFHSRVSSSLASYFFKVFKLYPTIYITVKILYRNQIIQEEFESTASKGEGYLFTARGRRVSRNSLALTSIISDQCQVLRLLNAYSHNCAPIYNEKVVLFHVF